MPDDDKTTAQARNLAAVSAWIEAYNSADFEGLAAVADDTLRVEDPATGTHIEGLDAFADIAREVLQIYPDRRIMVTQMIPLGDSAVAVQGDWQGTAASDTATGAHRGDVVHHVESMVVELAAGRITLRLHLSLTQPVRPWEVGGDSEATFGVVPTADAER